MAASSADDHLTVGGDANVVVGADPEHAAGTRMRLADLRMLDDRTQYHPVSATINNLKVCSAQAGPSSIVLPCVAAAEQDSASDG